MTSELKRSIGNRVRQIIFGLAILAGWLITGAARAAGENTPPLPPGVRLLPLGAPEKLAQEYQAWQLEVDWTHPLLRASLRLGIEPGSASAPNWARVEQQKPGVLRLQLIEPETTDAGDRLALPVWAAPATPENAHPPVTARSRREEPVAPIPATLAGTLARSPHFSITPFCPWLPGGPPLDREPELASPLDPLTAQRSSEQLDTPDSKSSHDPALAPAGITGVRWLGRTEDVDDLTSWTFERRCLLSWTQPQTGRTRFCLVDHPAGGMGRFEDLLPWLKAESRPGDWLAVHSEGRQALAGLGDWRLGGTGAGDDPRHVEQLGAALELAPLQASEPVDWTRLRGVMIRASGEERDFAVGNVLSGRLWPLPLAPPIWISPPLESDRDAASGDGAAWVEIEFTQPRPIDAVVLAWPPAAGWSGEFNPRRARLLTGSGVGSDLQLAAEIKAPAGPVFVWRPGGAPTLDRIRVEFPNPSQMPLDTHARLAAIQAWGPWDGTTKTQ